MSELSPPLRLRNRPTWLALPATPLPSLPRQTTPFPSFTPISPKSPPPTGTAQSPPSAPSSSNTLKQLRKALEETPVRLRELEERWRLSRVDGGGGGEDCGGPVKPRHGLERTEGLSHVSGRVTGPVKGGNKGEQGRPNGRQVHDTTNNLPEPRRQRRPSKTVTVLTPPSSPVLRPHTIQPDRLADHVSPLSHHSSRAAKPTSPYPIDTTSLPLLSSPSLIVHPLPDTHLGHGEGRYAATVILPGYDFVHIARGGRDVVSKKSTGRTAIVKLDQWRTWSEEDKRLWMSVFEVVEKAKKTTIRVKIYHPLGRLGITCSTPPEVVLSFSLSNRGSIVPHRVRIRLSQSLAASRTPPRTKNDTYSKGGSTVQIDTATKDGTQRTRTRRVVALGEKGLEGISTATWGGDEREAVRRLIATRLEWGKYV